jgi:hypothetical protein
VAHHQFPSKCSGNSLPAIASANATFVSSNKTRISRNYNIVRIKYFMFSIGAI